MTPTPRIYLASKSPRRRDLLRQIGVNFDVLIFRSGERGEDADVDETPIPGEAVERYVERLALAKAQAGMRRVLWRKMLARPVLAADTTLELDGEIIGKPADAAEARDTLRRLSGRRFADFEDLFEPERGVPVLVVTFVALLELAREHLVEITQAEAYAPIYVRLAYTPAD